MHLIVNFLVNENKLIYLKYFLKLLKTLKILIYLLNQNLSIVLIPSIYKAFYIIIFIDKHNSSLVLVSFSPKILYF